MDWLMSHPLLVLLLAVCVLVVFADWAVGLLTRDENGNTEK